MRQRVCRQYSSSEDYFHLLLCRVYCVILGFDFLSQIVPFRRIPSNICRALQMDPSTSAQRVEGALQDEDCDAI